ncbi:MAG TPA: hypothetical protein PLV92_24695, partial [Pirellulaceae bacterium]|nr:hypothetical protein [Pirellulaceae bacterium]
MGFLVIGIAQRGRLFLDILVERLDCSISRFDVVERGLLRLLFLTQLLRGLRQFAFDFFFVLLGLVVGFFFFRQAGHQTGGLFFLARQHAGGRLQLPLRCNVSIAFGLQCLLERSGFIAGGFGFALGSRQLFREFAVRADAIKPELGEGAGRPEDRQSKQRDDHTQESLTAAHS